MNMDITTTSINNSKNSNNNPLLLQIISKCRKAAFPERSYNMILVIQEYL